MDELDSRTEIRFMSGVLYASFLAVRLQFWPDIPSFKDCVQGELDAVAKKTLLLSSSNNK